MTLRSRFVLLLQKSLHIRDLDSIQHVENRDVRKMGVAKVPRLLQGVIDREPLLKLHRS